MLDILNLWTRPQRGLPLALLSKLMVREASSYDNWAVMDTSQARTESDLDLATDLHYGISGQINKIANVRGIAL